MKSSVATHNLLLLSGAFFAWLVFCATGAGAWGLFLPLILFALVAPAVVFSLSQGPLLLRPFIAAAPSVAVSAFYWSYPHLLESWAPFVAQLVFIGAAAVFFVTIAHVLWLRSRAA